MEKMSSLVGAEKKVLGDVHSLLAGVRPLVATTPNSAPEGVKIILQLRDLAYENLNQISHEFLIILAARWLATSIAVPSDADWYWNPRQTGDYSEPDLQARVREKIIVSAEATTSVSARGTIADRMVATIEKLRQIPGKRYYFVRTENMAMAARAAIKARGWRITVVCLMHD